MPRADLRRAAHAYRLLVLSRIRSQQAYSTSFALDVVASILVGLVEFAEVWIVFHNVDSLGGLSFAQVCLLFGIAHVGFSFSQVLFGHVDRIPLYLRTGTLEAFHLRPLSVLGQLVTSEVALRRLGWGALSVVILGWALTVVDIAWSPAKAVLLALCLASSIALFAALFVAAAGLQFFLVDGQEMTNAFTYGGRYASQQPASIFGRGLAVAFVFAVPVAFTGYVPALGLLDVAPPDSLSWLRPELAWATPLVAAWTWVLALGCWRIGTRHYQGGGG
ncbi:ABC transporter permease [Mobilicoccus caccae]|uniref:ABC transporter permease n=1 Tax=Mobilicoccus caccae TaxID=1859295 RepID=A0ABQ6IMK3_9MICO|nr:ABC-2 family transporter protein [Mobilicoccus caccae]GMA38417.1 ABC transporter permease [Mobilicoccus caccae]